MLPYLLVRSLVFVPIFINTAFALLTPYADAACTQPVVLNGTAFLGTPDKTNNYQTWSTLDAYGITKSSPANWYSNIQFPGAQISQNSYNVWWRVIDLDMSCRAALLTDYAATGYWDIGPQIYSQPPGNVVLNAGKEGCYFSSLKVREHWLVHKACPFPSFASAFRFSFVEANSRDSLIAISGPRIVVGRVTVPYLLLETAPLIV
jgi:hypothetical protein